MRRRGGRGDTHHTEPPQAGRGKGSLLIDAGEMHVKVQAASAEPKACALE